MAAKNYNVQFNTGYTIVNLDSVLDYNNCKSFEHEIPDLMNESNHVLINCEQIVSVPKDWARAFSRLQQQLTKQNRHLKLIHVNRAAMDDLKRSGLDTYFKISKDANEALKEFGITVKRSLDTNFINPFLSATMHVLKVQAQTEARPGQIYRKKDSEKFVGDISGIIGVVSESFNGSVVISFPELTFLKIISNMLGEEFTVLDQGIIDGAGEITNMIFGQAKIVLNEKGYGIKTAIPSVVIGKNHSLSAMTKGPVMVIPFDSDMGKFFVEICLSA
jgi:chemotaxis protein CheX